MTIQISEKLIFKGEQMQMPISSSPSLPKDHPQIVNGNVSFRMSACWRSYVGTWAVKDDKLFLVDLHGDVALSRGLAASNWDSSSAYERIQLTAKLKRHST